jgi:hypothetical protein
MADSTEEGGTSVLPDYKSLFLQAARGSAPQPIGAGGPSSLPPDFGDDGTPAIERRRQMMDQPSLGSRLLSGAGDVIHALSPKTYIDAAARASARAMGLPVGDEATVGSMLRAAAGLAPGQEADQGFGERLGGKALEFGTDVATDPLTWAMGGLGSAITKGRTAAAALGGAARLAPEALGALSPEAAQLASAAVKAGKVAEPIATGAGALFTGQAALGAAQEVPYAVQAIREQGLTPETAETALGAGLTAGMAAMGGLHMAGQAAGLAKTPAESLRAPVKGQELLRGSVDAPATTEGLRGMVDDGAEVRATNPDLSFTQITHNSDRTKSTAQALNLGPIVHDDRWQSRRLAGLETQKLTPELQDQLEALAKYPDALPPGQSPSGEPGETTLEFLARTQGAVNDLLSKPPADGSLPTVIASNSNIQAMKWALESGDVKDAQRYLGKGGYGSGVKGPGSMFIIDRAGKLVEWDPSKAIPDGTKAAVFRHAETPFNAGYEEKGTQPGGPQPNMALPTDAVPEELRDAAATAALVAGRRFAVDGRTVPDLQLPEALKPYEEAIRAEATQNAAAIIMGRESLRVAVETHDGGPDGLTVQGATDNPQQNFDVIQRAAGRIVTVAEVRDGKLTMLSGGRELGSPVSSAPVQQLLDDLGVQRPGPLTPFGIRARLKGEADAGTIRGVTAAAPGGELPGGQGGPTDQNAVQHGVPQPVAPEPPGVRDQLPQGGAAPAPGVAAGAPVVPNAVVGLSHVKAAFPGVEVKPVQEGYSVRLSGGREIFVTQQGELNYKPEDFAAAYGRAPGDAEKVLGEYRRVGQDGVVWLAKDADPGIVHHEAFHAAMDMVLSPAEREAVLKKYGSEEEAATAYSDWTPAKTNSWFTKILSFFTRIYRSFRPSWESAFEAVRGGEAFGRDVNPAGAGGPQFAAAPVPPEGTPSPTPSPGGPVVPPEAGPPRVEGNVESLLSAERAAGQEHEPLAREAPSAMTTDTAARTAELRGRPDDWFLQKVARNKQLDQFESQELDARTRGKYAGLAQAQEALDAARIAGSPNIGPLSQDVLARTLDYIAAQRAYVNDGTNTARALAARAVVQAADITASNPDTFMRTLFQKIPGISDSDATRMLQAFKENPQDLPDLIREAIRPTARQKFFEGWRAMMLSPASWIAKAFGDGSAKALDLAKTAIAPAIERVLPSGLKEGTPERFFSDLGAAVQGVGDGFSGGWDRFLHGLLSKDINLSGNWTAQEVGAIGKGPQWFQKLAPGVDLGQVIRMASFGPFEGITDVMRADAARSEMYTRINRQVQREAIVKGKTNDSQWISDRKAEVQDAVLNTKAFPEIRSAMEEAGNRLVFNAPLDGWEAKLQQLRSSPGIKGALTEAALPFYKVPLNITKMFWEHTALNLPSIISRMKSGELRGGALADELAKQVIGAGIGTTFALAAHNGIITGGGPSDPKQRDELVASGWQPYSFRIPTADGGNQYISYHRLEPISSIVGMAADLVETQDELTQQDMAKKVVGAIGTNIFNRTFLKGLSDFTGAIHDPVRAGGILLRGLAGSAVPAVIARGAGAIDPTVRDVAGSGLPLPSITGTIASRLPGVSSTLPPKLTGTGEPETRGGPEGGLPGRIWSALTPFPVSTSDPSSERVAKLFEDIGFHPAAPEQTLTIPGLHRAVKVQLTPEERQYLSGVDARVTDRVRELAQDPRFLSMDPLMQKYYLQRMYLTAGMAGRRGLMMQPDFQTRAQAALGQFRESRPPTSPLSPGGGIDTGPSAGASASS